MEALVITFERRSGDLERLLLAPARLPALLAWKILGGVVFGLVTAVVVLARFTRDMGALVSVAVKEVFEARLLPLT